MNKKRLLAAALLLSMPILSGCSSMVSERAMEDISALTIEAGAEVPTEDKFADEVEVPDAGAPGAAGKGLIRRGLCHLLRSSRWSRASMDGALRMRRRPMNCQRTSRSSAVLYRLRRLPAGMKISAQRRMRLQMEERSGICISIYSD